MAKSEDRQLREHLLTLLEGREAHASWEDVLRDMALVGRESSDLHARIPHGSGQTLLREALLVADHNAYHLGQIVLLRKDGHAGRNRRPESRDTR